jgi:hypothetical protein
LGALSQVERAQEGEGIVCAIDFEEDSAHLSLVAGDRVVVPYVRDPGELVRLLRKFVPVVVEPISKGDDPDLYPAEYSVRAWWAELLYDLSGFSGNLGDLIPEPRVLSIRREGSTCYIVIVSKHRAETVKIALDSTYPPFDTITELAEAFRFREGMI